MINICIKDHDAAQRVGIALGELQYPFVDGCGRMVSFA